MMQFMQCPRCQTILTPKDGGYVRGDCVQEKQHAFKNGALCWFSIETGIITLVMLLVALFSTSPETNDFYSLMAILFSLMLGCCAFLGIIGYRNQKQLEKSAPLMEKDGTPLCPQCEEPLPRQ